MLWWVAQLVKSSWLEVISLDKKLSLIFQLFWLWIANTDSGWGWSMAIGQNAWLSIHLSQKNHIIKSIFGVEAGQLGKMYDSRSTYLKKTYCQVSFLGWSRAIGQNVLLSIHLSQKKHIIKSVSWVEAGQLSKMCDSRSTYLKGTILSSQFLGWSRAICKIANFAKLQKFAKLQNFAKLQDCKIAKDLQIAKLQSGKMCDCGSTYLKRTILSSQFLGLKQDVWAQLVKSSW